MLATMPPMPTAAHSIRSWRASCQSASTVWFTGIGQQVDDPAEQDGLVELQRCHGDVGDGAA